MTKRLVPLLLTLLASGLVPQAALAKPSNVSATRTYIEANYKLVRAARGNLPSGEAAIKRLVRQTFGQCARAAVGSPENHNSEQLSDEVVGALSISIFRYDVSPIETFARTVKDLSWSNGKLTRMVRTYVKRLRGLSKLALPDICGDVKAWAANGYGALPASTTSFIRRYDAVNVEAEEVSLHLFRPYESSAQIALLRRTKQLEAPLAQVEVNAVANYTEILDALELQQ
jgi:hypothetical protein